MMKIQAVVVVNFDAKTNAKRTVDNSETEKQMQTNFKEFGFSFQKKGYSSAFNSHLFCLQNMNAG